MKKLLCILSLLASFSVAAADYWEKIAVPTTAHLLSISFPSPSVGYIGGTDSTLLKTTDGGKTWLALKPVGLSFSTAAPDIIDVQFISTLTGFAVVGSRQWPEFQGSLYKTVDGGANWSSLSPTIAVSTVSFVDADNGFVAGSGFFSGRTIQQMSAGSWLPSVYHSSSPSSFLKSVAFWDKRIGIVGGDDGFVYRTFDGGTSWDTVKTNIDTTINSILYIAKDTLIAASSHTTAAILRSTDAGKTWQYDPASMTFHYPAMKAVTKSRKDSLIFVGHSITTGKGVVYWFGTGFMSIFNATEDLNDVAMANDSIGFITGDKGLLLSNRHLFTSRIGEAASAQNDLSIYPNPAQDYLLVETRHPSTAQLYTISGILVWESKVVSVQHSISTRELPQGVYLLRVLGEDGSSRWQKVLHN